MRTGPANTGPAGADTEAVGTGQDQKALIQGNE